MLWLPERGHADHRTLDWTVALRKEVVPRHQERRDEDVPAVVTPVHGLSHWQAVVCKPSEFS